MGNNKSAIEQVHLRMYSNIIQIKDPIKRLGIINTCLASMEYVSSAKRAGIYSYLLNYVATVNSGGAPPLLPGEQHISQQGTIPQQTPNVPRSMQPNFHHAGGPGATHPSLINQPTASSYTQQYQQRQQQQIITHTDLIIPQVGKLLRIRQNKKQCPILPLVSKYSVFKKK